MIGKTPQEKRLFLGSLSDFDFLMVGPKKSRGDKF